jgi:hypothetical protein
VTGPPPNPLVVAPEHEDAQPAGWEGAGVASSWADLHAAATAADPDAAEVAYTAAGAGLATLGAVVSPLDALFEAGLGWVVEHVWWLHEPLDALAGDPTQITAQARTWNNVAGELDAVARDHRGAAALPEWAGAASDAYRGAVDRFAGALERAALDAADLAGLILTTGAHVGTVRALVRDAIVAWVSDVAQYLVLMGVAALVTAGGAVGAAAIHVIVSALELAEAIARRIRQLLAALEAAGGTAQQLGAAVEQTAAAVRAAVPTLRAVDAAAEELRLGWSVESGKQATKAEQEQRGWGAAPA